MKVCKLLLVTLLAIQPVFAARQLPWTGNLAEALKSSQKSKKLVLVDVYTSHCMWCRKLDLDTFQNPGVIRELGDKYIFVRLNAETERSLLKPYQISGYPTILLLNGAGKLVGSYSGYMTPEDFVPAVENKFKE